MHTIMHTKHQKRERVRTSKALLVCAVGSRKFKLLIWQCQCIIMFHQLARLFTADHRHGQLEPENFSVKGKTEGFRG